MEINATNFPDENFREYVSKFIDKNSDGKLSQNECDAVEDIGNPTDTIFKNIKGIEYFTKLETLVLEPCDIKNLDLSKNINLNRLRILDNKSNIQTLDLTKNTKLDTLHLWNSSATNVKVGKNIKSVDLWWSDIGTLDVSECTGLEFFICGPQLKNLIMRKNQVIEAVFNYKGEKDSSAKKWASSNNKVVSIDKTTGKTSFGRCDLLLKCVNTGTSVITSTMDGKTIENFKVTVKGNGWQQENGKWRYYDANGKYYTGWHYMTAKEGEKTPHWSYFGKDGILYTGWKKMGKNEGENTEHWSYFGNNGWLRTGWQQMGKGL